MRSRNARDLGRKVTLMPMTTIAERVQTAGASVETEMGTLRQLYSKKGKLTEKERKRVAWLRDAHKDLSDAKKALNLAGTWLKKAGA